MPTIVQTIAGRSAKTLRENAAKPFGPPSANAAANPARLTNNRKNQRL